jgi:uncharacterized protein involved in exopolysaccharide biosynthesis
MMEEEIDLRIYIEVILRYWKWIVGLAVLAAVVAFVFSSLQAPTYEAEAVVLVTEPRYQLQFDSRFRTDEVQPAYKAFPTLATSDSVLQGVLDTYALSTDAHNSLSLRQLAGVVEASSEGDPSLVLLKVRSDDPENAAAIANAWADTLVKQGNRIYGGGEEDVTFFEKQVAQAEQALDEAEAALIEFQAHNQNSIIQAQLESLNQTQIDYLTNQRTIVYIIQDIQGLRAQMVDQPGDQATSLADGLITLLLQIKAFDAEALTPVQLQVDSNESLSDKTLAEQIAFLDDLVVTLQAKSAEIDTKLNELEPKILELQKELQVLTTEDDRLTQARDLARETYLTLARKLDEARITVQETNGMLQVGSYAAVPEKPVAPRKLFNIVVAGMLGLMMGIVGAFAVEFWRQNKATEANDQ